MGDKTYAVRREGGWWLFRCLDTGAEHRASFDACTCEDHKYRRKECKHMLALRSLLR